MTQRPYQIVFPKLNCGYSGTTNCFRRTSNFVLHTTNYGGYDKMIFN